MKRNLYNRIATVMCAIMLFQLKTFAQVIVVPDDEPSFVSEYIDGEQWVYLQKNGFVVGITNQKYDNDYGNFYQIKILIKNQTDTAYTFDPTTIRASIINDTGEKRLKLYSYADYKKKVKRSKAWDKALTDIAIGLNSDSKDAYSTSLLHSEQTQIMDKLSDMNAKISNLSYLRKNTIHSGEEVFGYMNIKRAKGKSMLVVIPIAGENYLFEWDLTKKPE